MLLTSCFRNCISHITNLTAWKQIFFSSYYDIAPFTAYAMIVRNACFSILNKRGVFMKQ